MSTKHFSVETIPSGVEHVFNETVPSKKMGDGVYWKQGNFYFNGEKRVATVTDVKFVSDTILVVAHRAAAKLYLIELKNDAMNVLDTISLEFNHWGIRHWGKKYFHPDLIALHKNSVYMSEYSNRCCIVDIIDNKFIFNNVLRFKGPACHGCFSKDDSVLFGAVKNGTITIFDDTTKKFSVFDTGIADKTKRIKTIGMDGNNFVLGLDNNIKSADNRKIGGDSWVNLYECKNNKFLELDSLRLPNTQIDGHRSYKNFHFITMHDGDNKCGVIVILKVSNNKIDVFRKVKCESFPHGIDIYNDQLVYSSYTNSSITSHPLRDFLAI